MPQCYTKYLQKLKTPLATSGLFKLTVLFLGLLLSLTVTGCGAKTNPANVKTQLQLSVWGSEQEIKVLKGLLGDFEAQNPTVQVRLIHIPENYYQKLHLLIAGHLAPDVMMMNSLNFPLYAENGEFLDLKGKLPESNFYPQALAAFDYQGHQQAWPRDVSNLVVYYNKTLFRKAGLVEPTAGWTNADFVRAAQKLTHDTDHNGHPEQFGVSFFTKPPLFWLPFVWSAGGQLLDAKLTKVSLTSPESLEGLRFYSDLRHRYHIAPTQIEAAGAPMSQWFLQQKVAMLVSGRWSVPVFREQATFDWDVVPLPIGASGKSRVGIDSTGYSIAAHSKHPKEALALLEFLVSAKAIGAFTESGLIVPARKDVAESALFLNPKALPKHSRNFLSIIKDGVPSQTPPRWNEFAEVLGLALEPVWTTGLDPEQALTPVLPKLNQLLEGAH